MLTLRLTRVGKTKHPLYRLIVSEKSRDPWGRALEILGTYNPHLQPAKVDFKADRVAHWIGHGAQCSDTVWNLLVEKKIVKGEKRKMTTITKRHQAKLDKKKTEAKA